MFFISFSSLKKLLLSASIFYIFLLSNTFALGDFSQGLSVRIIPDYPNPNSTATLRISSPSYNLDTSLVSVYVNGILQKSEFGLKSLDIKTGDVGETMDITVSAKLQSGDLDSKNLKITPNSVDLTYEVIGAYKPLNYKGKSVPLSNSEIKIFSFAEFVKTNGEVLSGKALLYTWSINGKIDRGMSGIGKTSYYINRLDAFPKETKVSVVVSSLDGKIHAEDKLILKPNYTEIAFYLVDPLLPFSFKNIANPKLTTSSLSPIVLAVPYFISGLNSPELAVKWTVNGEKVDIVNGSESNKMTVNNSQELGIQTINLGFVAKSISRPFQSVKSRVKLDFLTNAAKVRTDYFSETKEERELNLFGIF